ncbi:MAG: hypothetical protein ABEK01_03580 [Candidatus Nanohaloarchaea archaeon]
MDKTLELVLAAAVIMVTGLAVMSMVENQSYGFMDFLDRQSNQSQCKIVVTEFRTTQCGEQTPQPTNSQKDRWNDLNCNKYYDGGLADQCN